MAHFALDGILYGLCVHPQLLEDVVGHILSLVHHAGKQVQRLDGLLPVALCGVHRTLDSLLCFNCKFLKCHSSVSFLYFLQPYGYRRRSVFVFLFYIVCHSNPVPLAFV